MFSAASDMSIDDAWESVKGTALAGWSKTTRRMRAAGIVIIFVYANSEAFNLTNY